MSIVLQSSGGGSVTIQEPTTASNLTATLPAATGTVMVSGNMPAFSVNATGGQSCANSTYTKIQFNSETFDTANCFDSTTNYRFTPNVAGYYQINGVGAFNGSALGYTSFAIYKNGSNYIQSGGTNNTTFGGITTISDVVYLNGSTDYVELYIAQTSGGALTLQSSANANRFSGCLVRTA